MMVEGFKLIGAGAATIALAGAAIGIGNVFSSLIDSVSRNPSLAKQLFGYAILGFRIIKTLTRLTLFLEPSVGIPFLLGFGCSGVIVVVSTVAVCYFCRERIPGCFQKKPTNTSVTCCVCGNQVVCECSRSRLERLEGNPDHPADPGRQTLEISGGGPTPTISHEIEDVEDLI